MENVCKCGKQCQKIGKENKSGEKIYSDKEENPSDFNNDWQTQTQHSTTTMWAGHKYDVGLIKNCNPVVVTPKFGYRPCKPQSALFPLVTRGGCGLKSILLHGCGQSQTIMTLSCRSDHARLSTTISCFTVKCQSLCNV